MATDPNETNNYECGPLVSVSVHLLCFVTPGRGIFRGRLMSNSMDSELKVSPLKTRVKEDCFCGLIKDKHSKKLLNTQESKKSPKIYRLNSSLKFHNWETSEQFKNLIPTQFINRP